MIQSAAILAGERIIDLAIARVVTSPQRVWPCSRQDGCSFTIVRIQLENTMVVRLLIRVTTFVAAFVCATSAWATVVSDWNAAALAEVRLSKSLRNGPPMVARALAIAHTCMHDVWAAYDDVAVATTDTGGSRRQPTEEHTDDNKAKAISFAAYRCLRNLYPDGSRSEAHTSELQSRYVISYAVFCLKKKKKPLNSRWISANSNIWNHFSNV